MTMRIEAATGPRPLISQDAFDEVAMRLDAEGDRAPDPEPYRMAAELVREVATRCDRCIEMAPATETVTCWYGCEHRQCAGCAEVTRGEASE